MRNQVVSRKEWLKTRLELLAAEKEFTRRRDALTSDEVGISVFYKDARGEVYHTYSCYSRGVDMLNGAHHYLDLVPKGRDEDGLKFSMEWVRRHDQY
jgi:predicted dithiol-disulfide oxidoreductase (DUF899 family)